MKDDIKSALVVFVGLSIVSLAFIPALYPGLLQELVFQRLPTFLGSTALGNLFLLLLVMTPLLGWLYRTFLSALTSSSVPRAIRQS